MTRRIWNFCFWNKLCRTKSFNEEALFKNTKLKYHTLHTSKIRNIYANLGHWEAFEHDFQTLHICLPSRFTRHLTMFDNICKQNLIKSLQTEKKTKFACKSRVIKFLWLVQNWKYNTKFNLKVERPRILVKNFIQPHY